MSIIEVLKDEVYINNIRKTDSIVVEREFTKTYTAKEKKLVIKDSKKLIDIEFLSSYHQMLPAGESVMVAEIKLKDWLNKNDLFDELGFYNREDYKKLSKQFTFKYCEEKTISMDLPVDFPAEVKENNILKKVVGDWDNAVEFTNLDELPHKDIRIGIFTKTILGEKIEWLPTIDGFDIYEWADYYITELHELEHDTTNGYYNSLVMIDTTHFILAYTGVGYDGFIKTFSINGSYEITELHELEHDIVTGFYNSLVMIDTTHFILAYAGVDYDGFIKTFSINGSYEITEIDELEHDTTTGYYNSLVMIDATHFILAYQGVGYDGFIKTFLVDDSVTLSTGNFLQLF